MPHGSCPHSFILDGRSGSKLTWINNSLGSSRCIFHRHLAEFGKTTFHIKWISAFDNFASLLFHTLDLMRYLISKSG